AFGFQQFPDHRPRNFPCAIGIAQLFAFGIRNQLVADTGVEEIPWHCSNPLRLRAPIKEPTASHKSFSRCSINLGDFVKKISLADFSFRISLAARAELSGPAEKGEPKWPGRPQRSWKCRSAWKSICMHAPPASKRTRQLHVLT